MACSDLKTLLSIATPSLVKAYGRYFICFPLPALFKVQFLHLKYSSFVSSNILYSALQAEGHRFESCCSHRLSINELRDF